MAESTTLLTLQRKRDEIAGVIAMYETQLERARVDLSHIDAALAVFRRGELPVHVAPYMNLSAIFKWGEIGKLCRAELAKGEPLDTRELAVRLCAAKGLNADDRLLRRAMAHKIVQALGMQAKRGTVESLPKRRGVRVWSLQVRRGTKDISASSSTS